MKSLTVFLAVLVTVFLRSARAKARALVGRGLDAAPSYLPTLPRPLGAHSSAELIEEVCRREIAGAEAKARAAKAEAAHKRLRDLVAPDPAAPTAPNV